MTASFETTVLIVGAGPVGLFASLLLTRQGIANMVVDRRSGPHRAPQAHVVNPRTLEICRAAGLDHERLVSLAVPRDDGAQVRWLTRLAGQEVGRLPYERQGDDTLAFTPTPLLNLSQHLFEPVLVERVRDQDGTPLLYGHEWLDSNETESGMRARIRRVEGGKVLEVGCRYLLAADGAGSRVRKSLEIPMVGPDRLQSFIMIHFEANLRAIVKDRPGILHWILDPEAAGTFVAHDIDRTWVFMHAFDADRQFVDTFDETVCTEIVKRAIGDESVEFRIRDISPWTMTAQTAEKYSRGRTFLVGDAAHRFPPSGGMGMNTGIQDAHNLAWKIAAVERGWAAPSLLQTYEIERLPVARANCEQSLVNALKLLELFEALGAGDDPESRRRMRERLRDPGRRADLTRAIENQQDHFDMFGLQLGFHYESGALVADGTRKPVVENFVRDFIPSSRPGSRLPHAWVRRRDERISTLDLIAEDGPTLITGGRATAGVRESFERSQIPAKVLDQGRDFDDPDGHWARVRGIADDGALLVRPDQHVAWRDPGAGTGPRVPLDEVLSLIFQGK